MEENKIVGFDFLVALTSKFIKAQKGHWDHTAWLNFLADMQEKGVELSDEITNYIGSVTESMKRLYNITTTTENIQLCMEDISEHALNFFIKTGGVWEQSEWEKFLEDLQKEGFNLTDEAISYLMDTLVAANKINVALYPIIKKAEVKEKPEKS